MIGHFQQLNPDNPWLIIFNNQHPDNT